MSSLKFAFFELTIYSAVIYVNGILFVRAMIEESIIVLREFCSLISQVFSGKVRGRLKKAA